MRVTKLITPNRRPALRTLPLLLMFLGKVPSLSRDTPVDVHAIALNASV